MAEMLSKALSCVATVIFWLSIMATSVTARLVANVTEPVSSTQQEPLLTNELLAALQEIATALKRNVELLTNNSALMKVARFQSRVLFGIEILKIFTGVLTQYLVDYLRKTVPHWNSQMPPVPSTLKDELEPFIAPAKEGAEALVRIATASERQSAVMEDLWPDMVNRSVDVKKLQAQMKDKLDPLLQQLVASAEKRAEALVACAEKRAEALVACAEKRAEALVACAEKGAEAWVACVKKGAEALVACAEKGVEMQLAAYVKEAEDLRTDMANLQAQLDAMTKADAERKEKRKRNVELIEECLKDSTPRIRDGFLDRIEGVYMTDAEASRWAEVLLPDS